MPLISKKDLDKRYNAYKKTFKAYEKEGHLSSQAIMRTAIFHNVSQSAVRNALNVLEKKQLAKTPAPTV